MHQSVDRILRIANVMCTIAYLYYDPTWEMRSDPTTWGPTFDQIYEDIDPERSQLQQLLQDAAQSPPQVLMVRRLEEFGDSLAAVTQCLTALESLGICVVVLDQPYRTDTGVEQTQKSGQTSQSDLLALLQIIDQHQRSRQICHGHAANRLQGLPPPGKAPYGYRRGRDRYVLDRTVVPVVRDFFDQFLLYGSVRGAVRHIAQKHGKTISVATGQRWLTHPVYRGDLEYRNQGVLSDTHVPILSRQEAAQIDRLLRRNRSLAPRAASAPRSLSGLVQCQQCQFVMNVSRVTARRQTREYLYLRPMDCPQRPKCRALPYQTVLEQTIAQICVALPQAVAGLGQPPLAQIKAGITEAIRAKQQVLQQLPELITQQILDDRTADLRAYTLRTELAELQNKLSQLPPVNLSETAKTVSIPQFWFDLSESERRFYFREFIHRIEIVRQDNHWSIQLQFIF